MQTDPTTPETADAQTNADVDAHARALLPGEPITLGTHTFRIRPLKVRQIFPFLALARPLFAALVARPASPPAGLPPPDAPAAGQGGDPPTLDTAVQDATWLLDVLEKHGPDVVKALAVGLSDSPEAWTEIERELGDLELPDLVTLVKHFVVVNAGFFVQKGLRMPGGQLPLAPLARAAGLAPAAAP